MKSGNLAYAWSDGSAKDGIGSHEFIVLPECTGDAQSIEGDSVTPGQPNLVSSLQCENFGALACALIVLAVEFKYSVPPGEYVQMHIDNM